MSKVDVWRVVQTGGLSLLDGGPRERCDYYGDGLCILCEGHRGGCCDTWAQRLDWHRELLWLRVQIRLWWFAPVSFVRCVIRAIWIVLRER